MFAIKTKITVYRCSLGILSLSLCFALPLAGQEQKVSGQYSGQVPGPMLASSNTMTGMVPQSSVGSNSNSSGNYPLGNNVRAGNESLSGNISLPGSGSAPHSVYSQNKAGDVQFDPNVSATKIYYEGAETIGRVGHQAILKRDVLHQLRKRGQQVWLDQIKEIPKEQLATLSEKERETQLEALRQQIFKEFLNNKKIYSNVLDNYIKTLLFYNDFVMSRPKDQVEEQRKKLLEIFDKEVLPQLLKDFDCKTVLELEEYYKKNLLSTLAEEKHLFLIGTMGSSWLEFNLESQASDPSVIDLRRYYEAHLDLYRMEERVRWLCMTVRFDNHPTRKEAYDKIARMGNYVMNARTLEEQKAFFMEVAQKDSEDMFAEKGGLRDWTKRGVLSSKIIEDAIYSQNLPVGQLSKILEDESGYTILCVLQREEATWQPFVQVQEKVKKKLIEDRRTALEKQYEEELSKRFTIELYNIPEEERKKQFNAYIKEYRSASGR